MRHNRGDDDHVDTAVTAVLPPYHPKLVPRRPDGDHLYTSIFILMGLLQLTTGHIIVVSEHSLQTVMCLHGRNTQLTAFVVQIEHLQGN